jgi:hypothetical protein
MALDNAVWTDIYYPFNMPTTSDARKAVSIGRDVLADPETGRLGRPYPADTLRVPRIEIAEGWIQFDFGAGIRRVRPPSDLLERFLDAKTDGALVKLAREYGPLGLIKSSSHGFPFAQPAILRGRMNEGFKHRERIEWWHFYRTQFQSLIEFAAAFRSENAPTSTELATVAQPDVLNFELGPNPSAISRRNAGLTAIDVWTSSYTRWCGLRPALMIDPSSKSPIEVVFLDDTSIFSSGLSLFGALTLQLIAAIAGSAFSTCSHCGSPFVPSRRPARGRRRYCAGCRKAGVPQKDAKADYRAVLRKHGVPKLGSKYSRRQRRSK